MKKRFLLMAAIVVGLGLTACSVDAEGLEDELNNLKEGVEQPIDETDPDVEEAVPGATYQCPDDCENGPSYDEPGPCVKCGKKMEIL